MTAARWGRYPNRASARRAAARALHPDHGGDAAAFAAAIAAIDAHFGSPPPALPRVSGPRRRRRAGVTRPLRVILRRLRARRLRRRRFIEL